MIQEGNGPQGAKNLVDQDGTETFLASLFLIDN